MNIKEADDSPFDQESLKHVLSLPQRSGIISLVLSLSKLLAIPIVFFGGIGLFEAIKLADSPARENIAEQHFESWLLSLLLAAGVMGIGGLLWFIHDYFVFDKAPLGSLVSTLFDGLGRAKIDKVREICRAIIKQTDGKDLSPLPILLSRALSFQVSAETASDEKQARLMAKEAIPLYRRALEEGLKTPLVHFGLATSARIEGENDVAINAYTEYLSMRPNDTRTREIMEQCVQKAGGTVKIMDSDQVKHPGLPESRAKGDEKTHSGEANSVKPSGSLPEMTCKKCGHTGFDYDRYWKEHTCKNCGWQTKQVDG